METCKHCQQPLEQREFSRAVRDESGGIEAFDIDFYYVPCTCTGAIAEREAEQAEYIACLRANDCDTQVSSEYDDLPF